MNIDTTLQFRGAHGVRVLGTPEAPLFVASDVCRILGIKNNRDAMASLDDDEKGVATADTLGGPQQVAVVAESGLYSLIFKSRKSEAKEFKRWVTSEVLPAIRRTGSYQSVPVPPAALNHADLPAMLEATASAIRQNQALNGMLSAVMPRNQFGSISESSGQPRTRLMPAYFTSRWPVDDRSRRFLQAQERQAVFEEIMDAAANRLGLAH